MRPLTLTRWLNKGFVRPAKLVDSGDFQSGRPSVRIPATSAGRRQKMAAFSAYFEFLWTDGTAKIGRIDPVAKPVATAEPYHYLSSGISNQQGNKYYASNLLEGLDAPAELFLDRKSGTLYLIPPSDLAKPPIEIRMLDKPMPKVANAFDVRIEGLTFDLGRDEGVILGGPGLGSLWMQSPGVCRKWRPSSHRAKDNPAKQQYRLDRTAGDQLARGQAGIRLDDAISGGFNAGNVVWA